MPNQSGVWTLSQQFQARGQGLWPASPGAPTIGTATAGNTTASVAFTAPTCTGYPAGVTSYTVTSTPGCITASGASSPISVTGLTNCTAYTFKVKAQNSSGLFGPCSAASNSVTPSAAGSQSYTTAGTYTWVAPSGVTSVSVVAIGGGASAWRTSCTNFYSGGGGGLGYKNNIPVTPGNSYTVVVGAYGAFPFGGNGGQSYFNSAATVAGNGGTFGGSGGSYTGTGGGNGGTGRTYTTSGGGVGGGGAGGYSGNGGNGGYAGANQTAGSGGGGGGGFGKACGYSGYTYGYGGTGGGTGILGQGANGAAGTCADGSRGGGGGSGGSAGTCKCPCLAKGVSLYGGGGSFWWAGSFSANGHQGGGGAVRIVWPGCKRSFPSTCVGNP